MRCDVGLTASMITGVFFSRETAEEFLQNHKYRYSDRAKVFCFSGHNSMDWKDAINNGRSNNGFYSVSEPKK